ncbi:tRNA(Ile)-lysidine synthase (tRNA(Ile)-lysidinesynthetase) (tRNA(Ile)-2-lysyl-cytidine synthase) [Candidatus Magnetoovum chiemensis]|nr:tRNA(Ile)-lysidine synthase (tRNA(Ile)-lysidinesynthetase) (tRNA(Ile)-2-lysyl-cytidine synthase) [Candidatus Magnetoovum chiemensis]
MCLIHVLSALEQDYKIYALYVDHGLRPKEIPYEIELCLNQCKTLNIPFYVRKITTASIKPKGGKQDLYRTLRYNELQSLANQIGADKIAVGHNKDDNAATILINLFRGSSLKGLSGIPPARNNIIRPLIDITRKEILDFLTKRKITYCTDSSNLKNHYLRNRLNHNIMPQLETINPDIINTLCRQSSIIRQEDAYLENIALNTFNHIVINQTAHSIKLNTALTAKIEPPILLRVLKIAISKIDSVSAIDS